MQMQSDSYIFRMRFFFIFVVTSVTALPCGENRAFVDLGANDGQSLSWFAKHIAPRAPSKFTSVTAFEMNPVFAPVLTQLLQPWGGTLEAAAAWTADGSLSANMQMPGSRTATKGGVLYNMTSSALEVSGVPLNKKLNKKNARSPAPASHEQRVSVPTVDFARWLAARYCEADHVHVKMDIEGAEWEVLEHLLRVRKVGLVDVLAIEWHTSKRAAGGARLALERRRQSILQQLERANVKVVDWSGKSGAM